MKGQVSGGVVGVVIAIVVVLVGLAAWKFLGASEVGAKQHSADETQQYQQYMKQHAGGGARGTAPGGRM